MKILYTACNYSPLKVSNGSSMDFDLYHAFLAQGASVRIVGPVSDNPGLPERIYRKVHRLLTKQRYAKFSVAFLKQNRHEIEVAIAEYHPDVIFSYFAAPLVYVKTDIPIVYAIDTTLIGSQSNWPLFSSLEYLRMLAWERKVLRKSAAVLTWSKWAAGMLMENYHIPAERISYFPIPASIPVAKTRFEPVDEKDLVPVRLLLVGRDYQRKGIDTAIQLVNLLNENGIRACLRIVGLDRPDTEFVKFFGNYDKSDPAQMDEYISHYRWAHFLVHPAFFEAAGIVPSEAAAFGVPTITNATGGLATTVQDGVSGVVLPGGSPAEKYAEAITYYLKHPQEYLRLRASTRKRYEEELNWDVVGRKIYRIVCEAVDERKG